MTINSALDRSASWHHIPIHRSHLDDGEIHDEDIVGQLAAMVEALARRRQDRSDAAESALSA